MNGNSEPRILKPPAKKRFRKHQRIRYSSEFGRVRENGQRWVHGCLIANWLEVEGRAYSRLGVITSRKIGKAHIRNRARRLMRESYRNIQHHCARPMDLILVARKSIANKSQKDVEADLLAIMKRRGLLQTCESS